MGGWRAGREGRQEEEKEVGRKQEREGGMIVVK